MIVDTSALLAIFMGEGEERHFAAIMRASDRCAVSAGSWIELAAVLTRKFQVDAASVSSQLAATFRLVIEPVTAEQARLGQFAYQTFGLGTGHPARLNFGDCFAYALAKATGEPLLFKGDDFGLTDIRAAA